MTLSVQQSSSMYGACMIIDKNIIFTITCFEMSIKYIYIYIDKYLWDESS